MKLKLYNSLTKKREVFIPIDKNLVKMYVCGPTVYDHPHIGNARAVVVYDILYRLLIQIYEKQNVLYVRNITDIDDKIINRAKEDNISISELTEKTTKYFHHDMNYLSCLRPNIEPKATDHVKEMIDIINLLLEKNIAYQINDHVYFDITKFDDYNKLSGRSFEKMHEGVRVENSTDKKNPGDFVLWKPALPEDDNMSKFDSPFGQGRPGWHIECSAMSHKYLGETFDIHGGGADLIFPHHTNEIAQSRAAFSGSEFAKTWVHNGFLTVNHEKMSKSLNNFITVQDLIEKGIKGDVIRLFLISNHYRKPIDYNNKAIDDFYKTISYWYRSLELVEEKELEAKTELPNEFIECLLDDLNTHGAIKIINDFAKQLHSSNNDYEKLELANNILACANFLGLMAASPKEWFNTIDDNTKQIDLLIKERSEAKIAKNWQRADEIRYNLHSIGISLEDKPNGETIWRKIN